jgi:hypothetical protein
MKNKIQITNSHMNQNSIYPYLILLIGGIGHRKMAFQAVNKKLLNSVAGRISVEIQSSHLLMFSCFQMYTNNFKMHRALGSDCSISVSKAFVSSDQCRAYNWFRRGRNRLFFFLFLTLFAKDFHK